MRGIIYAAIAGAMIWTLLLMGCREGARIRPEDRAQAERMCAEHNVEGVNGWQSFTRAGDARWLTVFCGEQNKMLWQLADSQ